MGWNVWYRIQSYVRSSLWIVPFIAIPFEMIAIRVSHRLDALLGWKFLGLAVPGAQATLQAIVSANLAFVVFTFGSMLIAIQVAGAQLTPRIIATTLLRNNVVKYAVGLFIFTLLFALSAQNRIDTTVNQFTLFLAALLGFLCFAVFFYLIDYASRLLRPISILARVGDGGLAVTQSVYPDSSLGLDVPVQRHKLGPPDRVIQSYATSGVVLIVDVKTLMAEAERANGVIEFVPQVGDFVAAEDPLFNLYGGAGATDSDALYQTIIFGSERTLDQDPTFAFRIIIDIALRALSPAINDPTTAVLAIDQLHRLLRMVGKRHLGTDEILGQSGELRVIFRTPNWEDFVTLSFSEIRSCGSSNLQIVRRLRAMIENLIQTLPGHRHPALQKELGLLDRVIEKHFIYEEELALARIADTQGLGGHSITHQQ